jgi:hypothetical protein
MSNKQIYNLVSQAYGSFEKQKEVEKLLGVKINNLADVWNLQKKYYALLSEDDKKQDYIIANQK